MYVCIFISFSTFNRSIICNNFSADNVLNLLSIPLQDMTTEKPKVQDHLVVIEDLNTFLQQRTHDQNCNRTRRFLCIKCQNFFRTEKSLELHKVECNNPKGQAEILPNDKYLEFTHWNNKFFSTVTGIITITYSNFFFNHLQSFLCSSLGFLDFETVNIDDPDNPGTSILKAYQYSLIFGNVRCI